MKEQFRQEYRYFFQFPNGKLSDRCFRELADAESVFTTYCVGEGGRGDIVKCSITVLEKAKENN